MDSLFGVSCHACISRSRLRAFGLPRRSAQAATITGVVSDVTGASLPRTRVVVRDVATGQESFVETDREGRYRLDAPAIGTYLVIATRAGFSQSARTVVDRQRSSRTSSCRFNWSWAV